jgi:hypothetical protein
MTRPRDLASQKPWYAKQPRLPTFPTVASVQDFFLQPEHIIGIVLVPSVFCRSLS